MNSASIFKIKKFSRIAAVAAVFGLGGGTPAVALDMICSNVNTMESAIDGTTCCSGSGIPRLIACFFAGGSSQCDLTSGPLQDCCDDPSETQGDQTACLCGEVSGFSDLALGFTPEGC